MFSQLTLTVYRTFFTYITTWNTPFQWNNQLLELEYTANKSQLLRWRLSSALQIFYTFFIYFRLYQFHIQGGNSINELILQIPFLCAFAGGFCAVLTVLQQSKEIIFIFNQMGKINYMFGKHVVLRKWDLFGVFIAITVTCITIFPYVCAVFFFFNRHGTNFLYSLVDTSSCRKQVQIIVFLCFIWLEILSLYAVCINFVTLLTVVSSFYMHCSYWMALNPKLTQRSGQHSYWMDLNPKLIQQSGRHSYWLGLNPKLAQESGHHTHRIFRLFKLHTQLFNEILSAGFLAPMKEIAGAAIIFPAFALILHHKDLGFVAILLLGFTFASGVTIVLALIFPAGWVWKYSQKVNCNINSNVSLNKRIRNSLSPVGVSIGSFYIIKNYTVILFFDILLRYLCTMLIMLKGKLPRTI